MKTEVDLSQASSDTSSLQQRFGNGKGDSVEAPEIFTGGPEAALGAGPLRRSWAGGPGLPGDGHLLRSPGPRPPSASATSFPLRIITSRSIVW